MNTGFDPVVVAPGLWKTQTATQQTPFHFGGSQVPINLGMRGSGIMKINRPKIPEALMRERMSGSGFSVGFVGSDEPQPYTDSRTPEEKAQGRKSYLQRRGVTQAQMDKYMARGKGMSSSVMPLESALKKEIQYEIRRLGGKKTKKGKMVDDALKEASGDLLKLRRVLDMAEGIDQIVMR